ncbi:MAG TPA: hypothetical protein VM840_02320 [Actinomycetota bacterium]|nr:hypothetical protein [Actinomycetota bacterium]
MRKTVLVLVLAVALGGNAPGAHASPSNDDFDAAHLLALPADASGSNDGATLQAGEPQPCGRIGATVWYRFRVTADARVVADTTGSELDTVLAAYVRTPWRTDPIDCNDDVSPQEPHSRLEFEAKAGTDYYLQVGGFDGEQGSFTLSVGSAPAAAVPNDDLADATVIDGLPWSTTASTVGSTLEAGEPPDCSPLGTVWYRLAAAQSRWVEISLMSDDVHGLRVFRQGEDGGLEAVSTGCTYSRQRLLDVELEGGSVYYIRVQRLEAGSWFSLRATPSRCANGPPPRGVVSRSVEGSGSGTPARTATDQAACALDGQGL